MLEVNGQCRFEGGKLISISFSGEDLIKLINEGGPIFIKKSTSEISEESAPDLLSTSDLYSRVSKLLTEVGIPKHVKGYRYLREAIILGVNDVNILNEITKELYPTISKNNNDLPSRVERAIRHSIELSWIDRNIRILNEICGTKFCPISSKKPTNSEYIALVVDHLRLELGLNK